MGSNLKYEGLQEVVKKIGPLEKPKEVTISEVNTDWRRLASFMSGKK